MLFMHSDFSTQAVALGWNGHLFKIISHNLQCKKVQILMGSLLCLLAEVQNLKSVGKKYLSAE